MSLRILPTECPRCNSEQNFVPKLREAQEGGWQEEYIRCTMCHFEMVLRNTTPEIELAAKKCRDLARQAEYERARHGVASQSLLSNLREVQRHWSKLIGDLAKEVWKTNGSTTDSDTA